MFEIEVRVVHGDWSAVSTAYASKSFFDEEGQMLLKWVISPRQPLSIEAGADTGWMLLKLYVIDSPGHARCAVSLATKNIGSRPAEISRIALELPTELGLVERFAKELIALGRKHERVARLTGLPTP